MTTESTPPGTEGSGTAGSGDYGYDLVHEDVRSARSPAEQGAPRSGRAPVPSGTADRAEDLSYDESHDFGAPGT